MEYLKQLEMYFATMREDRRLHLERRSRQYARSTVERTRVIPFHSVVRSFASIVLEEPHRATRNYGQVLARIPEDIFNEAHRPAVYFAAASSLYRAEFLFRNAVLERKFTPAKYHLLLASRLLLAPATPTHLNGREADAWAAQLIDAYWDQGRAEQIFLSAAADIEELAEGDFSRDKIRTLQFTEQVLGHYGRGRGRA